MRACRSYADAAEAADNARALRALQATIDEVSRTNDLDLVVPRILDIVAESLGCRSCAVFQNDESGLVRLQYWRAGGRTLPPGDPIGLDEEMFALMRSPATDLPGPVVLDHVAGTGVPEFDEFAVANGWEIELRIGVGGKRATTLCVYRERTEPYSPGDIALAEALAWQLGFVMEANRIAQEARAAADEARRVSDFLNNTIGSLSGATNLPGTVESIVQGLAREIGASHVFLFRHDPGRKTLTLSFACIHGRIRRGPSDAELPLWAGAFPDDITPAWRIMTEVRGLFTPEMTPIPAEEFGWPGAMEWARRESLSDMGHIVLFAGDRPVGSIGFGLCDGRKMTPADKPFIEGVANQAALAIAMADLGEQAKLAAIAEERQAAAQARAAELARANEALSRSLMAVSESPDFDTTLEKVFGEIVSAANAVAGQLFLYDAEVNTLATTVWIDESGRGRGFCPDSPPLLRTAFDADVTPAFRFCLDSKEIFGVNLENITPEQDAVMWPGTKEWHLARGRRSACAIPILIGRQPIGVIGLAWRDQFSFSAEQREVLFALTNQAAMVLDLRELAGSQRALAVAREKEHATNAAVSRVSDRLARVSDLASFVCHVLEELCLRTGAPLAVVYELEPDGRALKLIASFRNGQASQEVPDFPWLREGGRTSIDNEAWRILVRSRETVETELDTIGEQLPPEVAAWMRERGFRRVLRFPLIAGDRVFGLVGAAYCDEQRLDIGQMEFSRSMAHQVALGVQLTRLGEAANRAGVLRERNRIARDIHDTLAQSFTGILMQLQAAASYGAKDPALSAACAARAQDLAREGLREARNSVLSLEPGSAENEDLVAAIRRVAEQCTTGTASPCGVRVAGDPRPIPSVIAGNLLRICREALANAQRYASASRIEIEVRFESDEVVVLISDDGRGFVPEEVAEVGFGLAGMRTRVDRLKGSMELRSAPGTGTDIRIALPLPGRAV